MYWFLMIETQLTRRETPESGEDTSLRPAPVHLYISTCARACGRSYAGFARQPACRACARGERFRARRRRTLCPNATTRLPEHVETAVTGPVNSRRCASTSAQRLSLAPLKPSTSSRTTRNRLTLPCDDQSSVTSVPTPAATKTSTRGGASAVAGTLSFTCAARAHGVFRRLKSRNVQRPALVERCLTGT